MSKFKKAFHQYKTSLAFSLFNGGEKSRVPKILDDIDRHEYLAQSMFEAGQQSMQVKIDCLQVELKGAQERSQILLNHKNAMVGKLQSEIDELQKRIDAVRAIMNEYYTGSFDESAEMAGLISLALRGEHE